MNKRKEKKVGTRYNLLRQAKSKRKNGKAKSALHMLW